MGLIKSPKRMSFLHTMSKCHMPKLQHHDKMAHKQRLKPAIKIGFRRFFLFTEVSRFHEPYCPKESQHPFIRKHSMPKKLARSLQYK
jgi:hypothetical protein